MTTQGRRPTGAPVHAVRSAPDRLALGIERLGLIGLRFPGTTTLLLVALCLGDVFGVTRLWG